MLFSLVPFAYAQPDLAHAPSSYVLGSNDQVSLFVGELEDSFPKKPFG